MSLIDQNVIEKMLHLDRRFPGIKSSVTRFEVISMLSQISKAAVTFQAIGQMTSGRLLTRPCEVTFSGGSISDVEVLEDRISSTRPVRSFSFVLPFDRIISVLGVQTLLTDYSGPLTISELAKGGSIIESDMVDVIAILYLAVSNIEVMSHSASKRAEITINHKQSFASPAKVLSRPQLGCNVRIDEPAKITVPLIEALMAGEECLIGLR